MSKLTKNAYNVDQTAVIDPGVVIGEGTRIWHFSHILAGCRIGKNCTIGQNVMIGPNVRIGDNCKIQNNVSVFEGVTMEDDVFCGPGVTFTNDSYPRAYIGLKGRLSPTVIKKGASLGANATIVCGLTIDNHAMVGAGAVVTKDVAEYTLVVGNPATQVGTVCICGRRLTADLQCPDNKPPHEHSTR